jgi:T4-like virus tail tube protein gp19
MTLTQRAYSTGQFSFVLDHAPEAMFVKSFEGGLRKANVAEEQVGPMMEAIKHLTTREIEPVSMELGMQDAIPMIDWIRESWQRKFNRKSGAIHMADSNNKETYVQSFSNALLTDVTFPTLDASANEIAGLKVKFQPEDCELKAGGGTAIPQTGNKRSQQQRIWSTSCFRMELLGLDLTRVNKIDSFTVKQGVKPMYTGKDQLPYFEPTKLQFPDITFYMSLAFANSVIAWYDSFVNKGKSDRKAEKTGAIEFLAFNKKDVLFRINLDQVGIKSMAIDKSEKGDAPRRVKFELYVGSMDIDPGALAYTS